MKMNLKDIFTQIIFTTVPIWVEKQNGEMGIGTGFFYQKNINDNESIPFIVTNNHVVKNAKQGTIALIRKKNESPLLTEKVNARIPGETLTKYIDIQSDLAIFPVGPILNQLKANDIDVFYRSIDESIIPNNDIISNLSAVEEITFIGYPSGILDKINNTPVVRKGITATPVWNNFNGKEIFLIDAGVYPGSSGSPVLVINNGSYSTGNGIAIGTRVYFLGVITETIQRIEEGNTNVYLGLGQVVRSSLVNKLVERVSQNMK